MKPRAYCSALSTLAILLLLYATTPVFAQPLIDCDGDDPTASEVPCEGNEDSENCEGDEVSIASVELVGGPVYALGGTVQATVTLAGDCCGEDDYEGETTLTVTLPSDEAKVYDSEQATVDPCSGSSLTGNVPEYTVVKVEITTPDGQSLCQGDVFSMGGIIQPNGRVGLWSIDGTNVQINPTNGCVSFTSAAGNAAMTDGSATVTFYDRDAPEIADTYTLAIVGMKRPGTPTPIQPSGGEFGNSLYAGAAADASTYLLSDNDADDDFADGDLGYKYQDNGDSCLARYRAAFKVDTFASGSCTIMSADLVGGSAEAAIIAKVKIGTSLIHDESCGAKINSLLNQLSVSIGSSVSIGVPLTQPAVSALTGIGVQSLSDQDVTTVAMDTFSAHNPAALVDFKKNVTCDVGAKAQSGLLAWSKCNVGAGAQLSAQQPNPIFEFLPRIPATCGGG